jgi:hypothetical protein
MNKNNLLKAASFSPRAIESPSAWLGHLPFSGWVIPEVSPKIFVELGTHHGHSYFSFCHSVAEEGLTTKCYAVDTWQGDAHAGQYNDEIFAKVSAYHYEHYAVFSRLMRMTFDEAATHFQNDSIELLHIDGLHTYEAVRHDFETWLPKLAPGAIVMFHDTSVHEDGFGVWKLWEDLRSCYPSNLEFVHSHGLGVLQLNNAPDGKRLEWLQPNSPEKQRLIDYFGSLGSWQLERHEFKMQIGNVNQSVVERDRQIAALQAEITRIKSTVSWKITKPLRFVRNTLSKLLFGSSKE